METLKVENGNGEAMENGQWTMDNGRITEN
jgi:hypothetical protein